MRNPRAHRRAISLAALCAALCALGMLLAGVGFVGVGSAQQQPAAGAAGRIRAGGARPGA